MGPGREDGAGFGSRPVTDWSLSSAARSVRGGVGRPPPASSPAELGLCRTLHELSGCCRAAAGSGVARCGDCHHLIKSAADARSRNS